jgi:hypothetical protein
LSETETYRVLARYAQAWEQADFNGVAACYAEGFRLRYPGRNVLSGEHVGKPASLVALAEFGRRTRRRLVAILDVMAGSRSGGIVVREALGPDATEVERVLVYTAAEGLLQTCTVFDRDQALVDRLVGPAPS